jgi:putative ABC transport system ATP-binding protein
MNESVPPAVAAVGVSRRFRRGAGRADVVALDGVDVEVPRRGFAVVTGPSGGGKSTLLGILAALDRPSAGRVVLAGEDLRDASASMLARVRRRVGLVFQGSPMLRRMTAWENVAMPLLPRGVRASERRTRAMLLLDRVGLRAQAEGLPEELSAGERQRVGIARALVADPEVLFADEPTSNLDHASADAVAALLADVHRRGRTVVVATHDARLLGCATESYSLEGGRLRRT